ncbi:MULTISPECIES: nuclear transport factor 2 family protein [unclassified Comamonas]|uniref:Nuclear transport factor 2 family protein n=1 Tax=Comamonas squillarum TaxID=2977320 RepID=A0ABY5ZVD8_9BURK|nr:MULTISPECIES: nuclear transport factor 2 family protein [unclassified Comamonas]PWB17201.1 isomerase [Comamonas sp. JNW]UXC17891.1 nuclear transport factor 2 family protein [Comamonas sp. PR12]
MSAMTSDSDLTAAGVQRLVAFYESLAPESLQQLGSYYAADAFFKDPFNEVRGVPAIAAIFAHMFETLHEPRFIVTQQLVQGERASLEWEFRFRFRRWNAQASQCIYGASLLRFDAQGRVSHHRDYWDAAEELYEKLPAIGALMRWLRRNASVKR